MFKNSIKINDGTGYIELHDFSEANTSHEARKDFVIKIASICYGQDPDKIKSKINLYDKLANESLGLPSSSFEFIPILLNQERIKAIKEIVRPKQYEIQCFRYKTIVYNKANPHQEYYYLTNLRALLNDSKALNTPQIKDWFNTNPKELQIIRENYFVFKSKITIRTARQFMRHEANFQEKSRRYTSAKRNPLEFYLEKNIGEEAITINTLNRIVAVYNNLITKGYKIEDVRDILPVSLYTEVWSGFTKDKLKHFIDLRSTNKSQKQIRELAKGFNYLQLSTRAIDFLKDTTPPKSKVESKYGVKDDKYRLLKEIQINLLDLQLLKDAQEIDTMFAKSPRVSLGTPRFTKIKDTLNNRRASINKKERKLKELKKEMEKLSHE